MAIYRLYPEKGTFIFSEPNSSNQFGNAGEDPILELGTYLDVEGTLQKNRILLQFSTEEIAEVLQDKVETSTFQAVLHLSAAHAENITSDLVVEGRSILGPWEEGSGRRDDVPYNTLGATWKNRTVDQEWIQQGGDYNPTGSNYIIEYKESQDIELDVTEEVEEWALGNNNGLLLKLEDGLESSQNPVRLSYYGDDTHTIYAPYLEFRWEDTVWTGSLDILNTDVANIRLKYLKSSYSESDIVKFRCGVRPKYPTRAFTTGSIYTVEYRLPQDTFWGIKDEYSEEMIVPFSEYTRVSSNGEGSFFILDMGILPPERYYRILLQVEIDGTKTVVNTRDNLFKVTRHG